MSQFATAVEVMIFDIGVPGEYCRVIESVGAPDAGALTVKTASWRLDEIRLAKAIELNAPDVPLLDLRG